LIIWDEIFMIQGGFCGWCCDEGAQK